jgi:hypothetical protein
MMMNTEHVIRELWKASGQHVWLAVWEDGSTVLVTRDFVEELDAEDPMLILRPETYLQPGMSLEETLADTGIRRAIERSIRDAAGLVTLGTGRT